MSQEQSQSSEQALGAVGALDFPPEQTVLRHLKTLVAAEDVKINLIAQAIIVDPILTLELLHAANDPFYTKYQPFVSTVEPALVRIGLASLSSFLERMEGRAVIQNEEVREKFESLRYTGVRTSILAVMIARQSGHPGMADMSLMSGLMSSIGHMIACLRFKEDYLRIAKSAHSSVSIAYRLSQEYQFTLKSMHFSYLRRVSFPEDYFFGLDPELKCKTTDQSTLRFIVQSAIEMIEAFDHGKWAKYSPINELPGQSNLRLLQFNPERYAELFKQAEAYLKSFVRFEARPPQSLFPGLKSEVKNEEDSEHESTTNDLASASLRSTSKAHIPIFIEGVDNSSKENQKSLSTYSEPSKNILSGVDELCKNVKDTEALVQAILESLTKEGPFVRAALLALNDNRNKAVVYVSIGEGLSEGHTLAINDPLSPLSLLQTKVKSFNASGLKDEHAPFGISSYAISPVRVGNSVPVMLYTDCGDKGEITFEARKLFRQVVGSLNDALKNLPDTLDLKSRLSL